MLTLIALLLSTAFPSASQTSWMRPESFHLTVGMSRAAALAKLKSGGWELRAGDQKERVIVDYADDKALTLEFHRNRLRSIRFELFTFLPDARVAFQEEKAYLRATFGKPKKLDAESVLVYDHLLPNIMAVLSDDPNTENGRQGIGVLVVRYFDPRPPD